MRTTTLSPKVVGMVETRSSISASPRAVRMRPSCGRLLGDVEPAMILKRLAMAPWTALGMRWMGWSTPSMRIRMIDSSRRGSMWMSLARCSKA